MDELENDILGVAYEHIEQSTARRVAGSTIWDYARMIYPDLAPVTIPARLRRLVSLGLLEKDPANSSSRTKVYGPTESGYKMWKEGRSLSASPVDSGTN